MAVSHNQNQGKAQGQNFEQTQAGRAPEQDQGFTWSFGNLSAFSSSPMGLNPQGEILSKLSQAMTETISRTQLANLQVEIVPLGVENNPDFDASVICVVGRFKDNLKYGAYHTLILEGSVEPVQPLQENIPNFGSVEVRRDIAQAFEGHESKLAVADALAKQFPGVQFFDAANNTVRRDFDLSDEKVIYSLTANSVNAVAAELHRRSSSYIPMSLKNYNSQDNLVVIPTFGNSEDIDANGQSVRADVQLAVVSNKTMQRQGRQDVRSTPVARLKGYVDLMYRPEAQAQQPVFPGYPVPQTQVFRKLYIPHFIITDNQVQANSLEFQLLAISAVMGLAENGGYINAFRPSLKSTVDRNGVDIHDIGGIGYETGADQLGTPGAHIDTKTEAFRPEHLPGLFQAFFHTGMMVSIDTPESGPNTWRDDVFGFAGAGNVEANKAIIQAADTLTAGHFTQIYQGPGVVLSDGGNRIQLGTYTDANGVERDIRQIGYLELLNLTGGHDLEQIRQWSDTFFDRQLPLSYRMQARDRLLLGLFPSIKWAGFARRSTFDNRFLVALAQAINACGVQPRLQQPNIDPSAHARAVANYFDSPLLGADPTGYFNGSYGQRQFTVGAGSFGRWGA